MQVRQRRGNLGCRAVFVSDVEFEKQHVAVVDDIVLAFLAQLARIARRAFAAERYIIVERDRFGADEAFFEIGVDFARRLRGPGAFGDGPCARFLRADGEEGLEANRS